VVVVFHCEWDTDGTLVKSPALAVQEATFLEEVSVSGDKVPKFKYLGEEFVHKECICPTGCDCQTPDDGLFSNLCPIHNEDPEPDEECPIHG